MSLVRTASVQSNSVMMSRCLSFVSDLSKPAMCAMTAYTYTKSTPHHDNPIEIRQHFNASYRPSHRTFASSAATLTQKFDEKVASLPFNDAMVLSTTPISTSSVNCDDKAVPYKVNYAELSRAVDAFANAMTEGVETCQERKWSIMLCTLSLNKRLSPVYLIDNRHLIC